VYQRAQRMSSPICQVVTNTNIMVRQIMAKRPIGKGNVPDLYSVLSAPERGKGWVQIAITIPKAHLRVLDAEAKIFGLRRGQFLEILFLNRIGQPAFVRLSSGPKYKLSRDELAQTTRFLWYLRAKVKKLLDDYLLELGMRPSAFVVLMLNEWAGLGPKRLP